MFTRGKYYSTRGTSSLSGPHWSSLKTRCRYVTRSIFVSLKSFAFPAWIFLPFKRRSQRSQTRIVKISRAYVVPAYAFSENIFTGIVHIPDVRRNILVARTSFANTKYSYCKSNKSNNADIRDKRVKVPSDVTLQPPLFNELYNLC